MELVGEHNLASGHWQTLIWAGSEWSKLCALHAKKYQAYHGSSCDINIFDSWSKPLSVCAMCQVLLRYKLLFRDVWDRHNDGYFASNVGSLFA